MTYRHWSNEDAVKAAVNTTFIDFLLQKSDEDLKPHERAILRQHRAGKRSAEVITTVPAKQDPIRPVTNQDKSWIKSKNRSSVKIVLSEDTSTASATSASTSSTHSTPRFRRSNEASKSQITNFVNSMPHTPSIFNSSPIHPTPSLPIGSIITNLHNGPVGSPVLIPAQIFPPPSLRSSPPASVCSGPAGTVWDTSSTRSGGISGERKYRGFYQSNARYNTWGPNVSTNEILRQFKTGKFNIDKWRRRKIPLPDGKQTTANIYWAIEQGRKSASLSKYIEEARLEAAGYVGDVKAHEEMLRDEVGSDEAWEWKSEDKNAQRVDVSVFDLMK